MRVTFFFICAWLTTTRLCSQSTDVDKERYAIIEIVLLVEEGFQLFHEPINNSLLEVTKGLTGISSSDTTITFDPEKTKAFLAQLQSSSIKAWDAKKVYRFKVINKDPLEMVGRGENQRRDSAHAKLSNRTVSVHRASLPIFIDSQSAFALVSSQHVTFVDGESILNSNYTRLYFLKHSKKRWKVTRILNLSAN
jgi:hypothetical protein